MTSSRRAGFSVHNGDSRKITSHQKSELSGPRNRSKSPDPLPRVGVGSPIETRRSANLEASNNVLGHIAQGHKTS